jgi:phosphate/sulfate permease
MNFDLNFIIVIILLILAAVDLTVGVANDAVNFLNSSVGSKAAKFKTALTVSAFGVLVGVFFSSGMMEIARSGIFNPEMFYLQEVLIIFLATMYTDVLLLDIFNTFGLPTSTTVSIVFGLLGSSIGMSIIKVINNGQSFNYLLDFLNINSISVIIIAIISSIFFAFIFGYLVQFITRLIFTFDFEKRFKKYGSIWSGFALTSLTLFIVLKGIRGASFITSDVIDYINNNLIFLTGLSFVVWTIIIQILISFTKINVLKIIVLIGTFGLALSFAANDLVNFIGAPLAGLNAYLSTLNLDNPNEALMGVLREPVKADQWILLISGIIMVTTLFVSKKARSVTKTEISLGRQDEGFERFESNLVARFIVRTAVNFYKFILKITPKNIQNWVSSRFDISKYKPIVIEGEDPPSFDLIRAAVILVVASGLISIGTSLKLPLSTTYVTFIVAMAAALPDKAWGLESAVYRVSGVITVIGGWFFTAFMALLFGLIITLIIYLTNIFGVLGFGLLVIYAFIHTGKLFKNKEKIEQEKIKKLQAASNDLIHLVNQNLEEIIKFIEKVKQLLNDQFNGFLENSFKLLQKAKKENIELDNEIQGFIKDLIKILHKNVRNFPSNNYEFSKAILAFQDISDRLIMISNQNYNYISNNHHTFTEEQKNDIKIIQEKMNQFLEESLRILKEQKFSEVENLTGLRNSILIAIKEANNRQLNRIKEYPGHYKRSVIFISMLNDTEFILSKFELILVKIYNLFDLYLTKKTN